MKNLGVSLIFLKKLLSIKYSKLKDETLTNIVQVNIQKYLHPNRHIAAKVFEDSIDREFDYFKVRHTFISYIKDGLIKDPSERIIIEAYFNPLIDSAQMAAERLQAYGCFSCLDSLLFLLSNRAQLRNVLNDMECSAYEITIPEELRSFFDETFSTLVIDSNSTFLDCEPNFAELNFFPHTSNFEDIPALAQYRLDLERLASKRFGTVSMSIPNCFSQEFISISDAAITDIATAKCTEPLNLRLIDPTKCGNFHRSVYIIWLIETGRSLKQLSGSDFNGLMNNTVDISKLLSPSEIIKYFPNLENDLLHECLVSALLHDAMPTDRSEHRLRKDLQELLIKRYDRNILQFIKTMYQTSPHVGAYFFHTCSQTFLTKLYDIFEDNSAIIETRCELLKWFGEEFNDNDALRRAQSLRLELKLQEVRGDIDDNRIIVDHARFHDWMSENVLSDLRDVSSLLINDDKLICTADGDFTNPVNIIKRPEWWLASIIDRCFYEFCTNKNYGVESYIGRRIRHGSLDGLMLTDVQKLIGEKKKKYQYDFSFQQTLDDWLERYKEAISNYGLNLLQIHSPKSHKKGKIIPTVASSQKTTLLSSALIEIQGHLRNGDIFKAKDYIYEYCWHFLEIDLKNLREELNKVRGSQIIENSDIEEGKLRCAREINSLTASKFDKLSIWLQKPNNISPTTSLNLLFSAVVDEAKEQFPLFDPEVITDGEIDLNLQGHGYHFFYDILQILVGNVAKHGKHRSKMVFSFITNASGHSILKITSEVLNPTGLQERINALFQEDISDAMSISRNSGIKKLRVLERDIPEIDYIEYQILEEKRLVVATIHLNLQRT
jgi:hypothetical protein